MRSRYSAYAREAIDYLIDTHHPDTRTELDRADLEQFAGAAQFDRLDILDTRDGRVEDTTGQVEFIAHFDQNGTRRQIHERSQFFRIDGRWYYHSALTPNSGAERAKKVGRNEPCPCGSGKKFKKCCG